MSAGNRILETMLDRLFASLVNGPSLNARPHASRQRIDLTHLSRLADDEPEAVLRALLSPSCGIKLKAKVAPPRVASEAVEDETLSDEEKAAIRRWKDQQSLLQKLRAIAEDARTYEQDTGVHVLYVGFPLLSLPPGSLASRRGGSATRRVLAPLAFIPVSVTIKRAATPQVELACKGEGTDRVVPNEALLAWLEQQTGQSAGDLFGDEEGVEPWREVCDIVAHVCRTLEIPLPPMFAPQAPATRPPTAAGRAVASPGPAAAPEAAAAPELSAAAPASPGPSKSSEASAKTGDADDGAQSAPVTPPASASEASAAPRYVFPSDLRLSAAPRADETEPGATLILSSVLGLFPMPNQGLLRDMQVMAAGEQPLAGPVESFVRAGVQLDAPAPAEAPAGALDGARQTRRFTDERLVTAADPCQSRAVQLARQCQGLVIHGPPGTGKSQTIANIIGDHLSRGQRVLFVCEKRTALDVVSNRLEHMGLGRLCALIHDPQRDQRDLYRSVRQQLDDLPDVTTTDPRAEKRLEKIDAELQSLHAELSRTHEALMREDPATGLSFHALVGRWLALPLDESIRIDHEALAEATLADVEHHEQDLQDLLQRASAVGYATNPWRKAAGIGLQAFISRPMEPFRSAMGAAVAAAARADETADADIPPFPPEVDLEAAGPARAALAERLEPLLKQTPPDVLLHWSARGADAVARARKQLAEVAAAMQEVRANPLDANLAMQVKAAVPPVLEINAQLATLAAYIDAASSFFGFLAFGKRSAAARVLNRYGLTVSRLNAQQAHAFLTALRWRLVLQALDDELIGAKAEPRAGLPDDAALIDSLEATGRLLSLLHDVHAEAALAGLEAPVRAAMAQPAGAESLVRGLRHSPARAEALSALEAALSATGLLDEKWLSAASEQVRAGKTAGEAISALDDQLDTLEGVLRTRFALEQLPPALAGAARDLVMQSAEPEAAFNALRRAVLASEITRRLKSEAALSAIDTQRMASSFDRYRALDAEKQQIVRDAVLHQWTSRQKQRLLAGTGSRLNSLGADLRRRLTMRGERAMRLRQVLAVGREIEGGDPLFDICPVWMASPETVAQVFPRRPVFDVVIFDEASQCRLEEALPVLLRAGRVVIAGDPKQLPPTRFFESAIAQSDDEEIESDQQLFEIQQGEIEDLLAAALNLSIQQCYLDVHYRSRNADLIAFSNDYFYGSRLQAIPGHPSNRSRFAPVTLYHAGGTYADGENAVEAEHVCRIVRDLLKRGEPPSIGIACMNVNQRDLILDKLDALSAEDSEFARRLAEARSRQGTGSFEGLFVKNLENVQGDERDHIIISTTYGPDPQTGRFYRRFGPLGRAGGGRRLNVLVTRARQEVHLVTSIPPEAYRAVPPVPPGQQPSGGWLLFAYLQFAEKLANVYERVHHEVEADSQTAEQPVDEAPATAATAGAAEAPAGSPEDEPLPPPDETAESAAQVVERPTRYPSAFDHALGQLLAHRHRVGSIVNWGNDGFSIDLALRHPRSGEDVTLGVLVDGSRFAQAQDPVEWDVFRTAIHQSQGWTLHRLWTPHFFRDPSGCVSAILKEADRVAASLSDADRDGIRVR